MLAADAGTQTRPVLWTSHPRRRREAKAAPVAELTPARSRTPLVSISQNTCKGQHTRDAATSPSKVRTSIEAPLAAPSAAAAGTPFSSEERRRAERAVRGGSGHASPSHRALLESIDTIEMAGQEEAEAEAEVERGEAVDDAPEETQSEGAPARDESASEAERAQVCEALEAEGDDADGVHALDDAPTEAEGAAPVSAEALADSVPDFARTAGAAILLAHRLSRSFGTVVAREKAVRSLRRQQLLFRPPAVEQLDGLDLWTRSVSSGKLRQVGFVPLARARGGGIIDVSSQEDVLLDEAEHRAIADAVARALGVDH